MAYKECGSKTTIKKIIIETLNGVIVKTGFATLVQTASAVTKTLNYVPVNLSGTATISDDGTKIEGLKPNKGYDLKATYHNVFTNTIELQLKSCADKTIDVVNEFGALLKRYTMTNTTVVERPKTTVKIPIGITQTQAGVLAYILTLNGFDTVVDTEVEWNTLEFHPVLGGVEGSVVVKEKSRLDLPQPDVFVNCNLKIEDLWDMTDYDLISENCNTCQDGMTGELHTTTTYQVGKKITHVV